MGDGPIHEIPERAKVTFYYEGVNKVGNPRTKSWSGQITKQVTVLYPEGVVKSEILVGEFDSGDTTKYD